MRGRASGLGGARYQGEVYAGLPDEIVVEAA